MDGNVHILVLCGSAHKVSLNLRVANLVHSTVEASGNKSTLVHLGEENLSAFRGYDQPYPKRVKEILRLMMEVDGYVIVSPEYHHTVSAALKNLFEYIDDDKYIIEDRPAALISASIGQFGGVQSQWAIYGMLRTLRVWLVPDELFIPRADEIFLEDGSITDKNMRGRVEKLVQRLLRAAELLRPLRWSRSQD